jgi:hypothetical protein
MFILKLPAKTDMIGGLSFPLSAPVALYAVRRRNLPNSAGYYYTGKQGICYVFTYMELKDVDLGILCSIDFI